MYCRKCGKEIEENSKFCPYCGYGLQEEQNKVSGITKQDVHPQKESKGVNPKKWIIPVVIVMGTIFVAIVVFLRVKNTHKPEKISESEVIEGSVEKMEEPVENETEESHQNGESETEEPVQEVFQERPFTPDVDTETSLKGFVREIAYADYFGNASITYYDDAEFCAGFLAYSAYHNGENGKLFNKYPYEDNGGGKAMEESVVANFLQDSLGKCNISTLIHLEDGRIQACEGDPGSRSVESVTFHNMTEISEVDIRLEGVANYTSEGIQDGTGTFVITMTRNPDSVWGGYMLKQIDSWERDMFGRWMDGEVLYASDSRYLDEEWLSGWNAYDLYLARNEIYARHGYIFKNQDLQEYFGSKSWYRGKTKEVPDSSLNEYERANVQLILSLENKLQ